MKRTILALLLALICGWGSAQQRRTYVSEGFQGAPYYIHDLLWDISESKSSLDVLYYSETQEAGGVEPWEGLLGYWPDAGLLTQLDGTYRYVLRKNNTLTITTNYASVKYYYRANRSSVEGARVFGLAARKGGGEWTVVRQISKMTDTLGQGMLVGELPEDMRGAQDVQICVFYTTPKDNTNYFLYIDDIEFFAYMDNAYGIDFSWNGMPFTTDGQLAVDLVMTNKGNKMESCEISYALDGGEVKTFPLTFADGFYPDQTYVKEKFVPEGWNATAYGKHTVEFWISKVNGNEIANAARQTKYLTNLNPATAPTYRYRPLVEHFSASSCSYCAPLNEKMNPIYAELGDTISLIKYPTDFPGNGDPYATNEVDSRRFYYNIGGVPTVVLDGKVLFLQGTYDGISAYLKDTMLAAAKKKVYFDMWFDTLAVDAAQNIHISLKVKAVGGAENIILHTAVIEGTTHSNATTNGETEFHNVMMKMLPNGSGRKVNLAPDTVYTFDYVYDMTQTHMEEFTDLQAVCFLQTASGEVLQSVIGKAGSYTKEAAVSLQLAYVPTYICAGDVPAGLRLVGAGGTTLTSVEVSAKVGKTGTPVVQTCPASLAWGESAYVVFEGLKATATGEDTVYFTVTKVNGAVDAAGQTVWHPVYVQPTDYAFLPALEDFTSANNAGSAVLNQYVDAFGDKVCGVKYPMKGDRYTRPANTGYAAKMGIMGAPGLALNGSALRVDADGKLIDEAYFEALLGQTQRSHSIMEVTLSGDAELSGPRINPQVKASLSLTSAKDISCRLYALLVETVTVDNAGSNGGDVKRVVQALLPDENGKSVNIRGTAKSILNESALNPKVENFDNLKLVLIIKDATGKEVLQTAEFPLKNLGVPNESVAAYETLSVYPNPASESVYLKGLEDAAIDVYSLTGVKVFGLSGVSGDYTLDVRNYVPGAYIIKVREGAKVSTARISVVR
ncbi:MAG: T9SS type A sorting domain-containing protein [Bacteroidales bacterium]|nr:T9SS type A sorting domain-containing protein [Bacteroidales bacterium]